jgi:hypothetical protein
MLGPNGEEWVFVENYEALYSGSNYYNYYSYIMYGVPSQIVFGYQDYQGSELFSL